MSQNSDGKIFIILVGGYGNIGDALIRRRALAWFKESGEIHAYVGNAPRHWLDQIGLTASDRCYGSGEAWHWLRELAFGSGKRVLVFDPGEVLLSVRQTPKEIMFLLLTIITRVRGGRVIRCPRAIRSPHRVPSFIHRMACRLSDVTLWRESVSVERMRCGTLVPDIGFSEPLYSAETGKPRDLLFVSLRGLRSFPSGEWFDGIKQAAERLALRIVVGSQVREDEVRSKEVSDRLGAELIEWGEKTDMQQEEELRAAYSRSRLVVSDRMHVLVLAVLAGAAPAEVVENPVPKIRDHFSEIGIVDISLNCRGISANDVADFLSSVASRSEDYLPLVSSAQDELQRVERDQQRVVASYFSGCDRV